MPMLSTMSSMPGAAQAIDLASGRGWVGDPRTGGRLALGRGVGGFYTSASGATRHLSSAYPRASVQVNMQGLVKMAQQGELLLSMIYREAEDAAKDTGRWIRDVKLNLQSTERRPRGGAEYIRSAGPSLPPSDISDTPVLHRTLPWGAKQNPRSHLYRTVIVRRRDPGSGQSLRALAGYNPSYFKNYEFRGKQVGIWNLEITIRAGGLGFGLAYAAIHEYGGIAGKGARIPARPYMRPAALRLQRMINQFLPAAERRAWSS